MKIAVCTINSPEIDGYGKYTTLNMKSYCNINGYDFIEIRSNLDPSRFIGWSKIKLVENNLNTEATKVAYDWIMYIDADSAITNKNIKIEDIIGLYGKLDNGIESDIIIANEDCCDYVINAGVFLIKNTEWSKNFLKIWYNQVQFLNTGFMDTSAFIWLYENNADVKMHTKVVKQRVMNSFMDSPSRAGQEGIWKEGDFIIHFAGYGNRDPLKTLAYHGDSNYVPNRDYIPDLLNKLGLYGLGVEIGVQSGLYSEVILSRSKLSKLYLCDPWKFLEDYRSIANINNLEHEKRYIETLARLARFKDRMEILRMFSLEAVKLFQDNSLDFVYIDANHKYEYALSDIKNWYPKVKKGGVMAGHDYLDGNLPEEVFGVRSAVTEYFKDVKCLYITNEVWPSWYVIKT